MLIWPRILLVAGFGLLGGHVAADVVEVSVVEWGPLMPLGPGESGRQLFGAGPTAQLDGHLDSVDVVHAEERDVTTVEEGRRKTVKMTYYFVRIRLDRDGYRKLCEIRAAVARRTKETKRMGHDLHTSVRIAGSGQGDRVFLFDKSETAELRLVLHEAQLLPLLRAVRKPWKGTEHQSTINLWTSGKIDAVDGPR